MVIPHAMRRGIASALIEQLLATARDRPVRVATGRDNRPAVALYARHGFAAETDVEVPPGIWVTTLCRHP